VIKAPKKPQNKKFHLRFGLRALFLGLFFWISVSSAAPLSSELLLNLEKAQDFVLKKKRKEALDLLIVLLEKEKGKPTKSAKILKKNINELSEVFLTDKSQQLYESAQFVKKTNASSAQQLYLEALRLDPDNSKITFELGALYLNTGDCTKAYELIFPDGNKSDLLKVKSIEGLGLLYAHILLCQNKIKEYDALREGFSGEEESAIYWIHLDINRFWANKEISLAKTSLALILNKDPQFIPGLYWDWKINRSKKSAEKYLSECQNLSIKTQSKYKREPQLCGFVTEVENEINQKK